MIGRVAKEPLVHFALLGALVFGTQRWLGDAEKSAPSHIELSEARVASLAAERELTWGRPLTKAELSDVVKDYARDEVLYREGLRLGLDRDDVVVRNRVKQKMEFLLDQRIADAEPTDHELRGYLAAHAERFLVPERLSFEHVFVSVAGGSEQAMRRALSLLGELEAGRSASDAGDATLWPRRWVGATKEELEARLGNELADRLLHVPANAWAGPIASPFGLHLVRVFEKVSARSAELDQVRDVVRSDFQGERRRRAKAAALAELEERYSVIIDSSAALGAAPEAPVTQARDVALKGD